MAATRKKADTPAAVGPGSDEDFTFKSSLGEFTVPSIAVAPRPSNLQMLRAQAQNNEALAALLIFEAAAGDAIKIIDRLPAEEQDRFLEEWGAHSGASLGESKRS